MAEQPPSGDRAVYTFLEMVALVFLFAAVETGVEQGKPPIVWGSCLVAGVISFIAAIKWGRIQTALGNQVVGMIEWLAGYRALLVLALAAYIAITYSEPRYRYGACAVAGIYVLWISIRYMRSIRRDLNRYVMPRRLSPRQAARLRAYLQNQPKHSIRLNVDPLDEEAREYAAQLLNAFRQGGWTVDFNTQAPYDLNPGLRINATGLNQPITVDPRPVIQAAFAAAGIQSSGGGGTGA
ncbi:MAG: hypothetical protein WAM52_04545, partial [Steroidobacteraceae bacterium]